jgi:gliding motility-associated-like protein
VDTVVVSVCDSGTPLPVICVNDTIFITVTPVNDAPVVDNETLTTSYEVPVGGDLIDAGDTDSDGNLVVGPVVDGPNNGTISINPDGTFTYTPSSGFYGNDTIIVSICDDGSPLPINCVNDTIFITVTQCPSPVDTDGDGLTDCEETTGLDDPSTPAVPIGTTNPNDPCDPIGLITTDTDGDGLTDCEETTGVDDPSTPAVPNGTTNPNNPCDPIGLITTDTDGDGLTDCEETTGVDDPTTPAVPNGTTNPNDPCDPFTCVSGIKIPDAFTPDGDGINDAFVIEGIEAFPDNEIWIFNRWGNEVFYMNKYDNSWEGVSMSTLNLIGSELPTGTYYYVFNTGSTEIGIIKGFVYLKR